MAYLASLGMGFADFRLREITEWALAVNKPPFLKKYAHIMISKVSIIRLVLQVIQVQRNMPG